MSTCPPSTLYKSPEPNSTLSSLTPVHISWDTSCFPSDDKFVDVYVYVAGLPTPLVQRFVNVPQNGSFQAIFKPKWWNSTPQASVKLLIIPSDQQVWNGGSQSPSFTLTYNATEAASIASASAAADTSVNDGPQTLVYDPGANGTKLSKGAIAAAVLIPLLFTLGLVFGFVFWRKRKVSKKRQRWSQHFENRRSRVMSAVIDGTYQQPHSPNSPRPVSSVGQEWRPRASMVSSNKRDTRTSSFFGRPTSAHENGHSNNNQRATSVYSQNQAGVGARKMLDPSGDFLETPDMRQTRTSAFFASEPRNSRVSFSDQQRPNSHVGSGGGVLHSPSRLAVPSPTALHPHHHQVNHTDSAYDYNDSSNSYQRTTSPTQRALLSEPSQHFPTTSPNVEPSNAVTSGTSDFSHPYNSQHQQSSYFPQLPAQAVSPDDAMRAYAAQRQASVRHGNGVMPNNGSNIDLTNTTASGTFPDMRAGPAMY